MLEEPNLMRRPLVITSRKAVFGYAPDEYDGL
jgi:arsenate reductase-like glutaredoxin family protein